MRGDDGTAETQRVARRYFEAWTSRDASTAASTLAEGFRFTSAGMTIEGRDAFLDAGAFPQDATTTMVVEAYQGEIGFQMYDAKRGDSIARIVEQLTVRDGLIVSSTFVTDMASFTAFLNR
jgi:SnoaL-like domain